MDPALSEETRDLLRAARTLLTELAEEADAFAGETPIAEPAALPVEPVRVVESVEPTPATTNPLAPEPSPLGPEPTLAEVQAWIGDCQRCGLCEGRSRIVFGDGNPEARLMFVGEGPGEQEDRTGLPFVGRAGELLTRMIERGLGIPRSEVYICNIVKCRPPGNRTPLADEVSTCRPFLDAQIDAVRPSVIVTLGKPASSLLLGRDIAITRVRGTWHEYRGIPVMPTLHPAYILRQYTEENRRLVWQDLKAAHERTQG